LVLRQHLSLSDFVLGAGASVSILGSRLAFDVLAVRHHAAGAGQFCLIASRYPDRGGLPDEVWEAAIDRLEASWRWEGFQEACELAERIDAFLATLEGGGPGRQVARECRSDLDLLPVLADWCIDNGLPDSATLARQLHQVVSSFWDRLWASVGEEFDVPDEEDEEDLDEEDLDEWE
jgi:hypothetical protein